ncbi:MAG: ABC transporter permease [Terriglobales bacterium]
MRQIMGEPFSGPVEADTRTGTAAALAALWLDARYALRQLRLNPGFSAPCIVTMAVGIGIGAAVFSISYDVALKPLPYPNPGALVAIRALHGAQGTPFPFLTGPEVDAVAASPVFADVAEVAPTAVVTGGAGRPRQLAGLAVTGNLFSLLGTRALIGRTLLPADARPGHSHVAVLSYACWRRAFGGRAGLVGAQVQLSAQASTFFTNKSLRGAAFTIVGVMPPANKFPLRGAIWIPTVRRHNSNYTDMMGNSLRQHRDFEAIARLRDGASTAQAERSLRATTAALRRNPANGEAAWLLSATSLRDAVVGPTGRQLLLWLLAALCVVLLTCLAVSNMLIARALARRQEVATRNALGADRARLFRQFLVESACLAAIASALGVALGALAVGAARHFPLPGIPRQQAIGISVPILFAVLAFSVLTGLIFGLAPAWQFASQDISPHLGGFGVDRGGGPGLPRLRSVFGAVQVGLAVLLTVGAVAASVGLADIMGANVGYRLEHLVVGSFSLSHRSCSDMASCNWAIRDITQRVGALPGVESAAVSSARPLGITLGAGRVRAQEAAPAPGGMVFTKFVVVTPRYFKTLRIKIIAGRTFT